MKEATLHKTVLLGESLPRIMLYVGIWGREQISQPTVAKELPQSSAENFIQNNFKHLLQVQVQNFSLMSKSL